MKGVIYWKNYKKKNINSSRPQWINNFTKISNGPVVFFGNEFFDAIPIKQLSKPIFKTFITNKPNSHIHIFRY